MKRLRKSFKWTGRWECYHHPVAAKIKWRLLKRRITFRLLPAASEFCSRNQWGGRGRESMIPSACWTPSRGTTAEKGTRTISYALRELRVPRWPIRRGALLILWRPISRLRGRKCTLHFLDHLILHRYLQVQTSEIALIWAKRMELKQIQLIISKINP